MLGIQFTKIGGAAKDVTTVGQLDAEMAGFDGEGTYATEMMVWVNGDYVTYGWSGSSGTDVLEDSSLDNKWLDIDLVETDDTLDNAGACWVKAGSSGTMIFAGEVSTGAKEVALDTGYNMVANPYPVDVPVTTFGQLSSEMAGFDGEGTYATEMMVWVNGDYMTYGWSGSSGTDVLEDSSLDNKWLNIDLVETDDTVSVGHGVWIKAGSAGSITFSALQ